MDDYQMHPITIDSIKSLCNCDYLDNDLVIFNEIAKVPIPDEPRRMGCILMALCLNGTATYNVDTKAHHVKAGDVIIISTNQVTDSFNMSADCSGMAFMMSETRRGISNKELYKISYLQAQREYPSLSP